METMNGYIPATRKDFEDLKGDLTEVVKIFIPGSDIFKLTGNYLLEKKQTKKLFFYRKAIDSALIDIVKCDSEFLKFRRDVGITLNVFHYRYTLISAHKERYRFLQEKLEQAGLWV